MGEKIGIPCWTLAELLDIGSYDYRRFDRFKQIGFRYTAWMALNEILETLFTEVFEGEAPGADGTWFVEGGEAIVNTLSRLTADEASSQFSENVSTIAGHVLHMTHYLQMSNAHGRGQSFEVDWEGSWRKQSVSAEEWGEALKALRVEKGLLLELMGQPNIAEIDEAVLGAIANIAHAAYHLGAIRQLFHIVKSRSSI